MHNGNFVYRLADGPSGYFLFSERRAGARGLYVLFYIDVECV